MSILLSVTYLSNKVYHLFGHCRMWYSLVGLLYGHLVWEQTSVHHLYTVCTPHFPTHHVSWLIWVVNKAFPGMPQRVYICFAVAAAVAVNWLAPNFVYYMICFLTLLCDVRRIWRRNTANAFFMIEQGSSNSLCMPIILYMLILSTFCKYIDNIDIYTTVGTINFSL